MRYLPSLRRSSLRSSPGLADWPPSRADRDLSFRDRVPGLSGLRDAYVDANLANCGEHGRVGPAVRDQRVDTPDWHGLAHGVLPDLGVVGKHDHLLRRT